MWPWFLERMQASQSAPLFSQGFVESILDPFLGSVLAPPWGKWGLFRCIMVTCGSVFFHIDAHPPLLRLHNSHFSLLSVQFFFDSAVLPFSFYDFFLLFFFFLFLCVLLFCKPCLFSLFIKKFWLFLQKISLPFSLYSFPFSGFLFSSFIPVCVCLDICPVSLHFHSLFVGSTVRGSFRHIYLSQIHGFWMYLKDYQN